MVVNRSSRKTVGCNGPFAKNLPHCQKFASRSPNQSNNNTNSSHTKTTNAAKKVPSLRTVSQAVMAAKQLEKNGALAPFWWNTKNGVDPKTPKQSNNNHYKVNMNELKSRFNYKCRGVYYAHANRNNVQYLNECMNAFPTKKWRKTKNQSTSNNARRAANTKAANNAVVAPTTPRAANDKAANNARRVANAKAANIKKQRNNAKNSSSSLLSIRELRLNKRRKCNANKNSNNCKKSTNKYNTAIGRPSGTPGLNRALRLARGKPSIQNRINKFRT